MVTLCLTGVFNISFHFDISGNSSCKILMVFLVAVAVIKSSLPPKLLSSPVDRAMQGRNACLLPLFMPQFTTKKTRVTRLI